jgi:hypothetical protein
MAVFLNNGVVVTVAGVNLSDHVSSVTLNRNFDELEITAMGDSGHKYIAGLEASSVTIDFYNDTATASVLQTLDAQLGTNATVVIKGGTAATSATNPSYTMLCLINGITPVNGGVADLSTQSVTWNVSGAVTKATA